MVTSIVQYDVCRVVGLRSGSAVDLAVVLQDDQLSDMTTRVVAPLVDVDASYRIGRATPTIEIEGRRYLVAVHLMTTLPLRNLAHPVANLRGHEQSLKDAVDLLFFGV